MEWDVRRFAEIDSTNRWVRDHADAPEGLVAVADHQTAGRGRFDRRWDAAPGSALLMSILLKPSLDLERLHLVTAAVALAARTAAHEVAGAEVALKWPNDLLIDDRKLAGVLAELAGPGAVVVGIGINVTAAPDGAACLGPDADRERLLVALLDELARLYGDWPTVAGAYRRACATIGARVRVELSGETFTGTALDVTDEGHLLVDVGTCIRTITAADVFHLRPA